MIRIWYKKPSIPVVDYLTCMYVLSGTCYERTWYQLRIPVVHAYSYKYEYGLQVHSLSLWHFPSCLYASKRRQVVDHTRSGLHDKIRRSYDRVNW